MSRYEWERGQIKLPASAVAGIKRQMRQHEVKFRDDVRSEVSCLHGSVGEGTRSVKRYRERLNAATRRMYDELHRTESFSYHNSDRNRYQQTVVVTAYRVLEDMVNIAERGEGTVHKPTVADIDQFVPPVSIHTTSFWPREPWGYIGSSIEFDGNTVTWSVEENNHSVSSARSASLAQLFFRLLDEVTWTRGTGGVIVGNDEYNREDDSPGGGGNYVVRSYPRDRPLVNLSSW